MVTTEIDRKTNIRYLTAIFPWKYGYARRVADALNGKGKKSIMGRAYSPEIVYQVIDKSYDDSQVEETLVTMVEAYTGKPISQVVPDYVPSC